MYVRTCVHTFICMSVHKCVSFMYFVVIKMCVCASTCVLCAYCLYVLLAAVASELTFISTSPIPKPRVFEEETDVSGHRLGV